MPSSCIRVFLCLVLAASTAKAHAVEPISVQVRQSFSWEFIDWLAARLNEDRGWDKIVAELMTAEGEAKSNPATLLLVANRMNNFPRPADLASTTGKLFMGLQLRCAQCHDH